MQIEKVEKLLNGRRQSKNSAADLYQIGIKESNGYVTSGVTRSLAAEIIFFTIFRNKKSANNVETYKTRTENRGRFIDW
jgi:hypothetical protein